MPLTVAEHKQIAGLLHGDVHRSGLCPCCAGKATGQEQQGGQAIRATCQDTFVGTVGNGGNLLPRLSPHV